MACLIAPATAAIVTTAINKRVPAKYHLNWLITMLWGGVLMLVVDHLISGELVPYPPFLTAGIDKIVPEVLTTGVLMTVVVFTAWIIMVILSSKSIKKTANAESL